MNHAWDEEMLASTSRVNRSEIDCDYSSQIVSHVRFEETSHPVLASEKKAKAAGRYLTPTSATENFVPESGGECSYKTAQNCKLMPRPCS
ncbi:hypothetical protein AA13595_0586 [Gluconacetobacter johannae DSM 13595]|nr:hypothetical protein AA13595_0586 [Gluconacetobacter johannae DSM 13595]